MTEATFIKGSCANKFSKKTKPRIFYISNKAITYHNGIPSVAAALKQCLERDEDDTVILCSNLMDVDRTRTSLNLLEMPSELYVPYLENEIPSIQRKKELLEGSGGSIIVSDYRSFRGCESSHCIIFTDLENPIAGTIMAEMLSRTMVDLDIIALPQTDATNPIPTNPIQTAFITWTHRGLVDSITVDFQNEDESSITFDIQLPTKTESVKIETMEFDFSLSYYSMEIQQSKIQ